MKPLPHSLKQIHFPASSDWPTSGAITLSDFRVRWVATRCHVSLATAETIVANAGFADGDRR